MGGSVLATDGYKFSMAEAGWPLRRETFYYAHRKGGLQVVPFDIAAEVMAMLPVAQPGDFEFLTANEYDMGAGFKAAIARSIEITALPRGAIFLPREPVFSVTGPSALVSWLEPLLLQLSFRIQVATVALVEPSRLAESVAVVTCDQQRDQVLRTLDAVGVAAVPVRADADGYRERVAARVRELAQIVGGPERLFEVGLRAASCLEQHLLALEACKSAGLTRTSHVLGAQRLKMTPVGTMGHEHVQRFGGDEAAFRAMSERRPHRSSYLLDTFDTMTSGIPAAFELIAERRGEGDSIRYDSGDKEAQYRFAAAEARRLGIEPVQILEDGFDVPQTIRFEQLRVEEGIEASRQVYGYGGYLVAGPSGSPLTRDKVAAVYKLSQTGKVPSMKFANESGGGKQSIPGRPVVLRRMSGNGPLGIVAQAGEAVPAGYVLLSGTQNVGPSMNELRGVEATLGLSPATQAMADALRERHFAKAAS